ncbi:NADPH-cytochrome-P450 oxidoreductase [Dictyostelium purpureum]|uniref:NADPH-cytochrome-P450 oxidoreductase n=1 Tax=Dictyostelium purpureum TaxID=5786 RepID=F0Z982_DICPU|nr:NADPH-cytochrome-P450 oxidoreductase [Dictyostelium purpureum]EGC39536.1 NADPH-cytochrome-P450 oxidoreductase [Dictyostelium purpureum]|eukprot:XP_003283983.1 NADPH-cytochrome-P450 oxidoreductase [Dictyostelium purpureum]
MDLKKLVLKPKTLALLGASSTVTYLLYKFFTQPSVSKDEGDKFQFNAIDPSLVKQIKKEVKERFIKPNGEVVPILIFYGTEYGLSAEVAKKLEEQINKLGDGQFWARIVDMEEYELIEFEKEQLVLIITSTYGDGVPPTTARPFFDYLAANQLNLSHIQFCVLALGDRSYPHYCAAGKQMDKDFERCQSKRIKDRVEVDQEDWTIFDRWIDSVCGMVPQLSGLEKRNDDYLYEKAKIFALTQGKHNKKKPYYSKLLVKRVLTKGDKVGIHLEFELGDSELKYIPGDALAILPDNPASEVSAIISLLKLSASTKVSTPGWHYQETDQPNPSQITLSHILTKCYDIHNLKPELLQLLRDSAKDASQKEKLTALLEKGTGKINQVLVEFLENHHLVDVLKMFSSARPPIDDILAQLAKLLPRYYSIASSMKSNEKTVSLCVAVVKYDLHGSERVGIASTHMADRMNVGDRVSIFVNNNPDFRLPADGNTPVLMIGPGTGIAPFISFIEERKALGHTGENHLFFGCRRSDEDFLYKEELEKYNSDGFIKLYTAFSRETSQKVYVQNRLLENSQQIIDLINNNGNIYICGDAKSMAPQVHETLSLIICKHMSIDEADAQAMLHNMEVNHRYQKDVWF